LGKPFASLAEGIAKLGKPFAKLAEGIAKLGKPFASLAEAFANLAEAIARSGEALCRFGVPRTAWVKPTPLTPLSGSSTTSPLSRRDPVFPLNSRLAADKSLGTVRAIRVFMQPAPSAPSAAKNPTSQELARYAPLVQQIVASFLRKLPPNVQRDDLVAAGMYGLLDALRKGGEQQGAAFEWYARVRIRGAVVDQLRTEDWLSRRARGRANQEDAASPESGVRRTAVIGFDDLAPDAQERSFADRASPSPLEVAEQRAESRTLAAALETLPARERSIVRSHYFEGVPFKTIAASLGVSEPRVSQLHARAMQLLKGTLAQQEQSEVAA
jgi:RNA polymerase sigma factor (sigma-70 family)